MTWHNDTCGCAECGNYGQRYNPKAIHNQSCGCAECGNYDYVPTIAHEAKQSHPILNSASEAVEMIPVPIELLNEVRALIAKRTHAAPMPRSGAGGGSTFVSS